MANIFLGSTVSPGGPFPITEDIETKGGYRVVADHAARDAIIAPNRKQGMLVRTLNDGLVWVLDAGLITWTLFATSTPPIITWDGISQTWAQVYAEITTVGGAAIVLIVGGGGTITVGSYDLTNVQFIGVGSEQALGFDTGALIDAGPVVGLNADNLLVYTFTPLMTAATTKRIKLSFTNKTRFLGLSASPIFDSTYTAIGAHHQLNMVNSYATNTGPLIFMRDATGNAQLAMTMFGVPEADPTTTAQIVGLVGISAVQLFVDALAKRYTSPVYFDATVNVYFRKTTEFVLPDYPSPSNALPTPSADNIGEVIYNATRSKPQMSTGSRWSTIATDPPVIAWKNPTPWSEVYAQIQDAGGIAQVILSDPAGYTIPAGSYDLAGVELIGYNADANGLQLDLTGVLLDAGPIVGLNLRGIVAFATAPLMTPNAAKQVRLNLKSGSALIGFGAPFEMFRPGGALTVAHFFLLEDSALRNDTGSTIFVNDATSVIILQVFGGLSSLFVDAQFAGVAGVNLSYYCDALNQASVTRPSLLVAPVTFNLPFSLVTDLSFTKKAAVDLPVASADNKALVVWDTTINRPRISDGATFRNFALKEGVYLWPQTKTWAQLYKEMVDGSGLPLVGTVYIPQNVVATITDLGVGAYDLSNIQWVGMGSSCELDFDPGVLIDGGPFVGLNLENIDAYGQAPLTTNPAKFVRIILKQSLLSNYFGGAALFSVTGSFSEVVAYRSTLRNFLANATDAIFNLTNAAAVVILNLSGGGQSGFSQPIAGPNVVLGVAGSTAYALTDALTQFDAYRGFNGTTVPGPLAPGALGGFLSFPNYTSAQFASASLTPSVNRKGAVGYDTVLDRPRYATATQWRSFNEGVYFWTAAKTWTQVWAEVQAGGGFGTIFVEPTVTAFPGFSVTAGTYDFTNIRFQGMRRNSDTSFGSTITLDPGVLIDGGTYVALRAAAMVVYATTLLTAAASAKTVVIELTEGSRFFRLADVTLFNTTATDNEIALINSSIAGIAVTTTPLFFLGSAGQGLSVSVLNPVTGISITKNAFGGVAGSQVVGSGDNIGGAGFLATDRVIAPCAFAIGNVGTTWPTAARPLAVANLAKGLLGYNTDLLQYEHWDGAFWKPHVTAEETRVSDGALVANTFVKESSATDDRIVQYLAADDPFLIVGIVLDDAVGAGVSVRMARRCGQRVLIKSDGVSAISRADILDVSTVSDGRVAFGIGGAQVSTARTAAAAVADTLVAITF